MSIRGAARLYNIHASSLGDHLHGRTIHRKRGARSILHPHEEDEIVAWLLRMQEIGHSITITQLKLKVAELTQTGVTPFSRVFQEGHGGVGSRSDIPPCQ